MKRLVAVRLVHWYHFIDQTFRFDGSALLLGDNGSGKSTVLDAIQWALVADQQQVKFNKAANEQSRRSLSGYVRHKIGSEDDARPGQQLFGRSSSTSHVMLEFRDDDDASRSFVCGVAMEAVESDNTVHRFHWVVGRSGVDDIPAIDGDEVRTLREFRQALAKVQGAMPPFVDAHTYREEIRHRLGPVAETFHRLIVKALDFKPIGEVRDFVFNYLLDERPIDTEAMQRNLENYKKLEGQAKDAEERIDELTAVCELGRRIEGEQETARSHRFMSMQARIVMDRHAREAVIQRMEEAEHERLKAEAEVIDQKNRLTHLEHERDRLLQLLTATPGFAEINRLQQDLDDAKRELKDAEKADQRARDLLAKQLALLDDLSGEQARSLRARRPLLFASDEVVGRVDAPEIVSRLRGTLTAEGALTGRDLKTWIGRLDTVSVVLAQASATLAHARDGMQAESDALTKEQAALEKGKVTYPLGVEALLHLLRAKLRGTREAQPLCELIDVATPRWRNAIEGFLNTRRFDVIVAPEDYPRALQLYERNKHAYALPGGREVFIANVGLVDIERMGAARRPAHPRSLAAHVRTDDPHARVFVDFVLGDVIAVDDEQELRKHSRAITETVMVYSGYVARQTPREVYARHYIGESARQQRLEEIARQLAALHAAFVESATDSEWLTRALRAVQNARTDAALLPDLMESASGASAWADNIASLKRQLDGIDRSAITALEGERSRIIEEIGRRQDDRDKAIQREQERSTLISVARIELEAATRAVAASEETLALAFVNVDAEMREVYEARFAKLIAAASADDVRTTYERQAKNIDTRVENLDRDLVKKKTEYVNRRGFLADVVARGFADFAIERERWVESKLPEFKTKIATAKAESIQQLAEDMIFRLREGLDGVRRQIDDLNRSLKGLEFGSERYTFALEVARDHRSFYDLIMSAAPEVRPIADVLETQQGARRTLEELFDRLTSAEARQVREELSQRADYREYFDYDLIIHHADGTRSRYGRVAGDKSGGETQTPYYIAIFASAHRLYRALALDGKPTCGLLLLDEAFSKMDESRIAATLRFARDLGLQLVLAMPKERAEIVAPQVTTSIYIHKDPKSGVPTVLDFTKDLLSEEQVGDDGRSSGEASDSLQPA